MSGPAELDFTGLPHVMPGELVPDTSIPLALYSPEGQLLDEGVSNAIAVMADWEQRKHEHYTSELTWRQHTVWLSTVWLGANHNWSGGPPLVWETMLQTNGDWSDFQYRYSTRAAALNGHLTIVRGLLAAGLTLAETSIEITPGP